MTLLKAMVTVGGLTGLSRIFGFLRDVITAAVMGAGPVADAFFVALKLPNFFRRVTAEGAFSVSFIPLYSQKMQQDGEQAADEFAGNTLGVMVSVLIPFTVIAMIAMPWMIMLLAPGFEPGQERYDLAVELSRITFPYLLLISLGAMMGGILNAHSRFAPFAAAPIFFNLCMVVALLTLTPVLETAGHALAWGVFAAGVVQLGWLYWCLKRAKIGLRFQKPTFNADIKKLFALMGPGALGASVVHINLFADMIIASFLPEGSISYLYYADRLNQLPLGMVGIAVGTALLPMLSQSVAANDPTKSEDLFNRALEVCFLLSLPAAVAFLVIAQPIIAGLFERGEFTSADTITTAHVLMGYSIGLPAYVGVKVLSTAFWSKQDTMSPVKVSIICTVMNIVCALIFIQFIGVAGIALSTGLMGWLQYGLLYARMKKHTAIRYDDRFRKTFLKIAGSSAVMGAVLWAVSFALTGLESLSLKMLLLVAAGGCVYGAGILWSGAISLSELKKYFKKEKPRIDMNGHE